MAGRVCFAADAARSNGVLSERTSARESKGELQGLWLHRGSRRQPEGGRARATIAARGGWCLAFDEANVACARALGRIFDLEIDPLAFPQELEDGAANRAAMEEMLDAALVADEAEALVDQKASDGTRRHTSVLREHFPRGNPGGVKLSAESGR